jgi:hypothetical protein
MSFRASHIATVLSAGFNWCLIFLERLVNNPVMPLPPSSRRRTPLAGAIAL